MKLSFINQHILLYFTGHGKATDWWTLGARMLIDLILYLIK
jgi:hypothetical protein